MSTTVHFHQHAGEDVKFAYSPDPGALVVTRTPPAPYTLDRVYLTMDDDGWEDLARVLLQRDAVRPIAALRAAPPADADTASPVRSVRDANPSSGLGGAG